MEAKKPVVQNVWPLRLRKIDGDKVNLPHVAKFSEVVHWQNAVKPIMLYEAQEELKEEDVLGVVKDREYFKRKQKNKRYYRKKNMMILEDSSMVAKGAKDELRTKGDLSGMVTSARMRFEGHKVNMELADNETERHGDSESSSSGSRYVLLQFIKREVVSTETGGGATTTINEISVIPVRDMYSFKKASYVPDETLGMMIINYDEKE